MIEIAAFEAAHLTAFQLQDNQAHFAPLLTQELADALEHAGRAATALHDGAPVACAGLADIEGRTFAWAFLGQHARPVMVAATRACAAMIERAGTDVFTHVRTDVPANVRWMRLLGFATTGKRETMPDGMDYEIWVRGHV